MMNPVLSVVVPAKDEAENLPPLLERLQRVMAQIALTYEVIIVDDGSRDASLSLLAEWNRRDGRVRTVSLSRNFGKEIPIPAGMRYATGPSGRLMDADLPPPPAFPTPV